MWKRRDATTFANDVLIPALKRRAKLRATLRVAGTCNGRVEVAATRTHSDATRRRPAELSSFRGRGCASQAGGAELVQGRGCASQAGGAELVRGRRELRSSPLRFQSRSDA
jgi:hypothetical protein